MDINGDGMADYVTKNSDGNIHWNLSTGAGWAANQTQGGLHGVGSAGMRFADINGDGMADYVTKSKDSYIHWNLSSYSLALLKSISNGLGKVTQIEFRPLTDPSVHIRAANAAYPVRPLKAPIYLVKDHYASDGLGGLTRITYNYFGAKTHLRRRASLGFEYRVATDVTKGLKETTYFRQDFPFIGNPSRIVKSTSAGQSIEETLYSYDSKLLGSGSSTRQYVYPQSVVARDYEIGITNPVIRTTVTQNEYNEPTVPPASFFGNLSRQTDTFYTGSETSGVLKHTSRTDYEYWPTNLSLGLVTRKTVLRAPADGSSPPLTRVTSFDYYSQTGLLLHETVEPDNTQLWLKTEYVRDGFGNPTAITTTGPDISSRSTSIQYETEGKGRFPFRITNAANQAEERHYDPASGNLLTVIDANGLPTNWVYDDFGRLELETRPDGTTTTRSLAWCGGACVAGSGAFKITVADSDGSQFVQILDLLQRPVGQLALGFGGAWTQQLTQYNSLGQVYRTSVPHFSADNPHWTTFTYDVIGRLKTETAPSDQNTPSGKITRYDYNGLETQETDTLNHVTKRVLNVLGKVATVTDANNGETTYGYDAFDNLTSVTPPGSPAISMQYDIRGRKIAMSDPDMGSWSYGYNALGQLTSQEDAKLQDSTLSYDLLGRPLIRTEPEGDTTWFYDTEWIGALTDVHAPGGFVRSYDYDGLGRPIKESTSIDTQVYETGYEYDSQSRVRKITYPAASTAFAVQYSYNSRGYLSQVSNAATGALLWRTDTHDALGNISLSTFGNNAQTLLNYDEATGMLNGIVSGSGSVQSLNYDWDPVGNLESRTDQRQGGLIERFTYDAKDRLATSKRNGVTNLSLTYDIAGNIKTKSDVGTYTYGSRPHVLDSVSGTKAATFSHDANGNMISGAGRTITWTSFNYPGYVSQGGESSTFAYGPDRELYKESVSRSFNSMGGDPTDGKPTAAFLFSCTLMTCQLESYSSADDRGIASYRWNFGDGKSGNGQAVSHVYATPGSYTVALTVTDTGAQTASTSASLIVPGAGLAGDTLCSLTDLPPPACPPLSPLSSELGGTSGGSVAGSSSTITETKTVHYVSGLFERHMAGGFTQNVHRIVAGGETVAVYTARSDGSSGLRYLHSDHLGSLDAVTDEAGRIVERLSYDAYGKRRVANWIADSNNYLLNARHAFDHGYTRHEHLDHVKLIHMKGRAFDPVYGRFVSADPYVFQPLNSQGFNRYGYTLNNPLNHTDSTGFDPEGGPDACCYNTIPVNDTSSHEPDFGNGDFGGSYDYGYTPAGGGDMFVPGYLDLSATAETRQTGNDTEGVGLREGDFADGGRETFADGWLERTISFYRNYDYSLANLSSELLRALSALPGEGAVVAGVGAVSRVGGAVAIRGSYLQRVDALAAVGQSMRVNGVSAETAVRTLAPLRNQLKLELRAQGSWLSARAADLKNLLTYGNRAGPSPDDLFRQYGSWDKALEALERTNPAVNRALGYGP